MPQYFLHLRECGSFFADDEGSDYVDLDAAGRDAIVSAREIMGSELAEGRLCLSCNIEIMDEHGAMVRNVPFKDAVTITGL